MMKMSIYRALERALKRPGLIVANELTLGCSQPLRPSHLSFVLSRPAAAPHFDSTMQLALRVALAGGA